MSEKDYGATLNLPKTSFQMKANLPNKEPKIIQKWEENKIYDQNRNLTLYSAKLRDPLFCRPFLRLYDIETEVDCKITVFI